MANCKCCGGESFTAYRNVLHEITVSADGRFLKERGLVNTENPFGPFRCERCGAVYKDTPGGLMIKPSAFEYTRRIRHQLNDRYSYMAHGPARVVSDLPSTLVSAALKYLPEKPPIVVGDPWWTSDGIATAEGVSMLSGREIELELRERLIGIAGFEVYLPDQPDILAESLLQDGQIWLGNWVKSLPAEMEQAVQNMDPSVSGCAKGYALYENGVWEPHIWLLKKENHILILDNDPALVYFGVVLAPLEKKI